MSEVKLEAVKVKENWRTSTKTRNTKKERKPKGPENIPEVQNEKKSEKQKYVTPK